jgi:hypothetical protein
VNQQKLKKDKKERTGFFFGEKKSRASPHLTPPPTVLKRLKEVIE